MSEGRGSDADRLLDRLMDASVVVPAADELGLDDAFLAELNARDEFVAESDDGTLETRLADHVADPEARAALSAAGDDCPALVAEYLTLAETTDLTHAERLRVLPFFDSFRPDGPPDDGVPAAFLAVGGSRVPFVAGAFEMAVVYVWKHDCPPCDLVRGDFDDLFDVPPDDIGLFAVHGPSSARALYDRYSVDGAPTVLFFLDGDVDVRLRGAESPAVLEREIEKLRTLAATPAER